MNGMKEGMEGMSGMSGMSSSKHCALKMGGKTSRLYLLL